MQTQNIKTLPFLEAVRVRFGMYAGTCPIPHVVKEIISNSLDEAKLGYGDKIIIDLNTKKNMLTVRDYGRGIPHAQLINVLTVPHTGGKFEEVQGTAGLNGIGVKIASALGDVSLSSYDGKNRYSVSLNRHNYKDAEVDVAVDNSTRGTRFSFIPETDDRFDTVIAASDLVELIEDYSYCNNVTITLQIDGVKTIYKPKKLISLMPAAKYTDVFTSQASNKSTTVEIAMCWGEEAVDHCFINGVRLINGGSHITLIRTALTRAMNKFVECKGEDARRGLVLAIKVETSEELLFASQAKDRIAMPSINPVVSEAFKDITDTFTEKTLKNVLVRLKKLNKALDTSKVMAELKNKTVKTSKFNKADRNGELIIIEGLSASGSINLTKDHSFQASYALRGKMLNTWGKTLEQVKNNEEIQDLVKILSNKWDRIMLLGDPDPDGAQIVMLVLCFIHNFFPHYIEQGRVEVINMPRMMGYNSKGDMIFFDSPPAGASRVEYFKGVGQVPSEALAQLAVNAKTRNTTIISYDTISADELELAFSKELTAARGELLLDDYDRR